MKANSPLAQIHNQLMWNRLIAVVEEQAPTLIRTAFSNTVREAGDLSAGVFDLAGRTPATTTRALHPSCASLFLSSP